MKTIEMEYPEGWNAVNLFEMGRLASGQAAQSAGVSRVAFVFTCPQWGVPAVTWDADGMAAEFKPLAS